MILSETLVPYNGRLRLQDVSFVSLSDIDQQLLELEIDRQNIIRRIGIYAAANPSEIFGHPVDVTLDSKLNDTINEYDDIVLKIFNLRLAKSIIEQYKFSTIEGMSNSVAFKKAVVDKYADLKQDKED